MCTLKQKKHRQKKKLNVYSMNNIIKEYGQ